MEFDLFSQMLIWAFVLAVILGVVANKTSFCTMGAVSDWVNMGDKSRLRSWLLAIATAIMAVMLMEWLELVDMSLTTSNETSNPPYRVSNFVWLRYLVGGLIFGVGMTLGSGCGNKTLLRLGAGNGKSIVVLLAISAAASLMMFTSIDYDLFLSWMTPLAVNFTDYGIHDQSVGSIVEGVVGAAPDSQLNLIVAALIGLGLFCCIFKSADFRANGELIVAGLVVGLLVAVAWWVTAGALGQQLLEEADFMDVRPYALGAQSFTFVAPTAHAYQYIEQGFDSSYVSFGLVAALGVICGSFVYALFSGTFRFEWFVNWKDFLMHLIGGLLMGVGGVLAMGCTIGQAITGASTLALGSFMAFAAIVLGSALSMKYQYYKMLYDDATVLDVFVTALVELRLLPKKLRRLEAL
ncbi:MAG: YeeE/YedE family protein [Gammaproteobacteria bacterium]|nr:YeeE/YedE family protein [Gammaproteobacteria bacterium]